MVPPFGFSVGDFINAIGLVNTVRKALKDVGGAEDDIQLVVHDLQHLELILIQLKDGDWGSGGDISHVNAIRGIALSCRSVLEGFLRKVESFQRSASCEPGSPTKAFNRGFKKVQWAISMKEEVKQFRIFVLSKLGTLNLLLTMSLGTALKKLENNTLTISDSLREKAKALMFDPGNCQLTIHMTRENLDDCKHEIPNRSTVKWDEGLSHQLADPRNHYINTKRATEKALVEGESIQRQTLALIPTGMILDTLDLMPREKQLTIMDMTTENLSMLGDLLETNRRICTALEQQNTHIDRPIAKSIEDSFMFQDVLGREHRLEYRWFQHWEMFAAMLKCVFKDMPGEDYVALNRYLIFDARSGDRRLHESTWGEAVFPGSRIKMSITISREHVADAQCPRCYRLNSGKCCTTLNLYHCKSCNLDFKAIVSSPEKPDTPVGPVEYQKDQSALSAQDSVITPTERELDAFRSIHAIIRIITALCARRHGAAEDRIASQFENVVSETCVNKEKHSVAHYATGVPIALIVYANIVKTFTYT